MEDKKFGIDVFQDGNITEEKEIFSDYSNTPQPKGYISKQRAMIAILSVLIILMVAAGSFAIGFVVSKQNSVVGDMPMLEEAYELVKKYYYKDISWDEFQQVATKQFITNLDPFAFMVNEVGTTSSIALGIGTKQDLYFHHTITSIIPNSPADLAEAVNKCENSVTQENDGSFTYINYTTITNVASEHVTIELGDRLVAVSFNGRVPILLEGLQVAYVKSLLNQYDDLILYIARSNGNGEYENDVVYQYNLRKTNIETKYAFLYTPEEIGDTTGTTAMITLTQFEGSAIKDFHDACEAFVKGGYTNLILDLRDNGGGDSKILQYVASCILQGADTKALDIIYYVYNTGNGKFKGEYTTTVLSGDYTIDYETTTYDIVNLPSKVEGFKMTVLCNGSTASSSEALIGAIKYYNKAQLIGTTTFGKGIGQAVFEFGEYYLYIPNGKYYIPTDEDGDGVVEWTTNIHGVGFTPDIETDSIYRPMSTDITIQRALTVLNN